MASQPRFYQDSKTGFILNEDLINIFYSNDELEQLLDKASSLEGVIPKELYNKIIMTLMTSNVFTTPYDKNILLLEADGLVFFSFFTSLEELKKNISKCYSTCINSIL